MTRTMSLLVVAFSAAVLGGAWLASVALTDDSSIPPPRAWPEPDPPAPTAAPAAVTHPREFAPAPAPPPPPPAPPPTVAEAATAPAPEPAPRAVSFESDEDFTDEHGPAVEQAWAMIGPEKPSPLKWHRAERVFSRCLSAAPENRRCQQGLETALRLIQSTRFPPRPGLESRSPAPGPDARPGRPVHGRVPSEE